MKNLRKTITLFAVLILVGIVMFLSCNKEEKKEQNPPAEVSNAFFDIDELIKTTGIDIYALSKLEKIQNVTIDVNRIEAMSKAKGPLTEALLAQINQLKDAIEIAVANEDYNTFFSLFEQFCTLTSNIDGIKFVINADGLKIIEYEGTHYYYPLDALEANAIEANDIILDVNAEFPNFSYLPEETQQEVLAAAFYLNFLEEDEFGGPFLAPSNCHRNAGLWLTGELALWTAGYIIAAGLCAGTTVAVFVCEGAAFTIYMAGCAASIRSYNNAIALCNKS